MRRRASLAIVLCIVVVLALLVVVFTFNPSALSEPGKTETYANITRLRILVWRNARLAVIPAGKC